MMDDAEAARRANGWSRAGSIHCAITVNYAFADSRSAALMTPARFLCARS